MGLCCSLDEQQHPEQSNRQQEAERRPLSTHFKHSNYNPTHRNSSYGVGMGIAMMMQQATALASVPHGIDLVVLEGQVRKAKAEGRTVTVVNGNLYFDYQLVAPIPPGVDFRV